MNTKRIIEYLQTQVDYKSEALKRMDNRCSIPRRIKNEIKELKEMIEHLNGLKSNNNGRV